VSLRKYGPSVIVIIYGCRLATYIMYGYGRDARSLPKPSLEDRYHGYRGSLIRVIVYGYYNANRN
jgi:hypothetical protein